LDTDFTIISILKPLKNPCSGALRAPSTMNLQEYHGGHRPPLQLGMDSFRGLILFTVGRGKAVW
jgi:hypothetical protein